MSSNNMSSNCTDVAAPWTLRNGSAVAGASVLSALSLHPFASTPPPPADLTRHLIINQTGITTWVLNHSPYSESKVPILYGNSSDGWNAETTIHFASNKTVDIIMRIANDSMDMVSLNFYIPLCLPLSACLLSTDFYELQFCPYCFLPPTVASTWICPLWTTSTWSPFKWTSSILIFSK